MGNQLTKIKWNIQSLWLWPPLSQHINHNKRLPCKLLWMNLRRILKVSVLETTLVKEEKTEEKEEELEEVETRSLSQCGPTMQTMILESLHPMMFLTSCIQLLQTQTTIWLWLSEMDKFAQSQPLKALLHNIKSMNWLCNKDAFFPKLMELLTVQWMSTTLDLISRPFKSDLALHTHLMISMQSSRWLIKHSYNKIKLLWMPMQLGHTFGSPTQVAMKLTMSGITRLEMLGILLLSEMNMVISLAWLLPITSHKSLIQILWLFPNLLAQMARSTQGTISSQVSQLLTQLATANLLLAQVEILCASILHSMVLLQETVLVLPTQTTISALGLPLMMLISLLAKEKSSMLWMHEIKITYH